MSAVSKCDVLRMSVRLCRVEFVLVILYFCLLFFLFI